MRKPSSGINEMRQLKEKNEVIMNHVIDQALTKINVQNKPIVLWRYVDDIFVAFNDMSALDNFFNTLNSVHNNITFTKELECGDSLAFLDVLIEKNSVRNTNNNVSETYSFWPLHALDKFHSTPPKKKSCVWIT